MLLLSLLTFAEVVRSGIEMLDIPTRALGGNLFEVILPEVQTLVKHVNHLVPAVEGFLVQGSENISSIEYCEVTMNLS